MSRRSVNWFVLGFALALPLVSAQAQKVNRNQQYKRVHQNALKKIVDGNVDQAVADLTKVLGKIPEDAESHYMLAVAHATAGNRVGALTAVQNGLDAGLPKDRFVAGTKTGLESIQDSALIKPMREAYRHRPAHGPMLGCITGSSVRIWLRTVDASVVVAKAWRQGKPQQKVTSEIAKTNQDSDFTTTVELQGLLANTDYEYSLTINGVPFRQPSFRFHTLADKGDAIKFRLAFGGGAGFVPEHEYMWNTIRAEQPDVLLLLGDNVYSDAPEMPEMQHYCYYRRQSRPEYRQLTASTPVFSIWDDHDFGTNDCSGGPAINDPYWKLPVYKVFRNNWVNAYYGGGDNQPGCNYDFYLGDVHFIMLDGRFYRNLKDEKMPTMLGPVQREWVREKIRNTEGKLVVLCSPVPWVFKAKGDSKDTWNGFKAERKVIFDELRVNKTDGVLLMSADRHRSDLWSIDRNDTYPLYEFNSSRLTNQHVHVEMKEAIFSYNKKQSFGTVDFDTTADDPTITYRVVSIDGEEIHTHTLKRSELISR